VNAPTDIVIVGAGVIGCSIAYELARRGVSVQLVDNRAAGMGATQASAGVLAPYIEARTEGPLLDLAAHSLDRYDEFVARVTEASGVSVGYCRTGTLDAALNEGAIRRLESCARLLAARGIVAEILDADRARSEEPRLTGKVVGGLLIPSHGFVAVASLTRALVAAARHHGAQILEPGRVRRIRESVGELIVDTDRGSLTGNGVVLAAGTWSGQIDVEGAARAPVKPVRGQLLQFWSAAPRLRRVTWGERCYLVPWDDGTLLVGATVEDAGFDERTTVGGVRDLVGAATELVPHVCSFSFLGAKAGLRPATPDELPLIGASTVIPNLMYATGHYRNGVLLAPLTAELVADAWLLNRISPMMEFTRPGRFGRL
jgi:glycine oxidase